MESLARYIIRASFSQERMTYIPVHESSDRVSKVIYASKDGKTSKTFDALDWLAQLVTHIPNKGEQMVRYYGLIYYVDPLLCPKCSGSMRILSFIEDSEIIIKILKHLDLWDVRRKPPARANGPPTESFINYDQSSSPDADDYIIDADYPIETYL